MPDIFTRLARESSGFAADSAQRIGFGANLALDFRFAEVRPPL